MDEREDLSRIDGRPPRSAPWPSPDRRTLQEEILVVLSLSLLASAAYAIVSLLSAPLSGIAVSTYPNVGLATQLLDIGFGLAPVWLVLYLVRRSGEGVRAIGLGLDRPGRDLGIGVALAAVVGAAGIGLYLASVALHANRFVAPVPPLGHWWTVPVLVLGAAQAALLEESVVLGFLVTRLRQAGRGAAAAVGASAVLRGAYHLYQGWGGFAGNLALGLVFGTLFLRWRRTWPFVVAHFLVDLGAGVGFLLFRHHLPGFH